MPDTAFPKTLNPYDFGLDKTAANHVPLSPLSFLRRTAEVHPDRTAIIHGPVRRTWAETYARCRRLASALAKRGVGKGSTVSMMAPNIPEMVEAHFGVPATGGVINAMNIRLDPSTIAYILEHSDTKVLITDREFSATIAQALSRLPADLHPLIVDIDDPQAPKGELLGALTYEGLLAEGDEDFDWALPADEWDAVALNYTSGTTGNPKGVVYHHRGAYLNALGNALAWPLPHHPVYLWTLPMFHCNGWCYSWTIAAVAGTHVCLRRVEAGPIFAAIADHGVTHMCGAPIVMGVMLGAGEDQRRDFPQTVQMMTGGAPPPAAVIAKMKALGIEPLHVYGLTEVFGPVVGCDWHEEWDALCQDDQATLKARQGVHYLVQEDLMVADPKTMEPVPRDGQSIGEVFMRGNIVMKGYLKDHGATGEAFAGGWFHTGDLGVMHENGYLELKDRSKDIIISGGENISTIEVEGVIFRHRAVLDVAVVARPDEKWGETPCAFVKLAPGETATEAEIVAHCREHLAGFKCPKTVVFCDLPKTSTGKTQKFVLRERARAL